MLNLTSRTLGAAGKTVSIPPVCLRGGVLIALRGSQLILYLLPAPHLAGVC